MDITHLSVGIYTGLLQYLKKNSPILVVSVYFMKKRKNTTAIKLRGGGKRPCDTTS